MKIIYLCFIFLFTTNLSSKSYTSTAWEKNYGQEKKLLIKDMIPNIQGGFTAVGSVGESTGKKNVFLTEFDKNGNVISEKTGILQDQNGVVNAIVQTPDGGYVLAGYTKKQDKFRNAWLMKLNEKGEIIWSKHIGGKGNFEFLDLTQDNKGNLAACGYANKNMYVAHYTALGQFIWKASYTGKKAQRATGIIALNDGFVVTGWEKMSNSYSNHILIRLDKKGNTIWDKRWWGTKSYNIIQNKSGDLVTITSVPSSHGSYHSTHLAIQITSIDGEKLLLKNVKRSTEHPICKIIQSFNGEYHIIGQFNIIHDPMFDNGKEGLFNDMGSSFSYYDIKLLNKDNRGYKASSIIQMHDGSLVLAGHSSNGSLTVNLPVHDYPKYHETALIVKDASYQEIKGNNNHILENGERGYYSFYLKNEGKNDAHNLIININDTNQKNNSVNPFPKIHVGHIAAGDSKLVQIPIIAGQDLKSANPTFDVSITGVGGVKYFYFTFEVNSNSKKAIAYESFLDLEWIKPDIANGTHRSVAESSVNLELQAISSHPLSEKHFTLLVNGNDFNNGRKFNTVRLQLINENVDQIQRKYTYKYTVSCRLESGNNIIKASVQNQADTAHAPAITIEIIPKPMTTRTTKRSNLYLLSIGVPHYDLQFTTKDAAAIADAYKKQEGILFDKVITKVLNTRYDTSADTLRKSISRILGDMPGGLKKNDLVIVYISSHGFVLKDGRFRIAAQDYDKIDIDNTTLDFHDHIYEDLNKLECNRLVLTDACQEVLDMNDYCPPCVPTPQNGRNIADVMEEYDDILGINSCSPNQFSYEDEKWGHGAFTKAFLEAFEDSSLDQNGDGVLSISELYEFLKKRVPEIVSTKKGLSSDETQVPDMSDNLHMGDTPVIAY